MQEKAQVFRMKKFCIAQQHAAMKVGTDGVLLGAWAEGEGVRSILDIGTGSGLIALMLAQRFPVAEVHAIELDVHAAEQALYNAAASPFSSRIQVFQASFQEWISAVVHTYDLVVCNPPFFSGGWEVPDAKRRMARDATFLPVEVLFSGAEKLLSAGGAFALILPVEVHQVYARHAIHNGWYLCRQTNVYSRAGKPVNRILSAWYRQPQPIRTDEIILEGPDGTRHSSYQRLTEAFYL